MPSPKQDVFSTSESRQLKTVTVQVSYVCFDDDKSPYAVTEIRRYDLEGPTNRFFKHVEDTDQLIHVQHMGEPK